MLSLHPKTKVIEARLAVELRVIYDALLAGILAAVDAAPELAPETSTLRPSAAEPLLNRISRQFDLTRVKAENRIEFWVPRSYAAGRRFAAAQLRRKKIPATLTEGLVGVMTRAEKVHLNAVTVSSIKNIDVMGEQFRKDVEAIILDDMKNFRGTKFTATRIKNRYKKLGKIERAEFMKLGNHMKIRHRASFIARTVTLSSYNSAALQSYKRSGVVQGVEWLSQMDDKTSDICTELHGMRWRLNSNHPVPPIHVNCRSTLIPIVIGEKVKFDEPLFVEFNQKSLTDVPDVAEEAEALA